MKTVIGTLLALLCVAFVSVVVVASPKKSVDKPRQTSELLVMSPDCDVGSISKATSATNPGAGSSAPSTDAFREAITTTQQIHVEAMSATMTNNVAISMNATTSAIRGNGQSQTEIAEFVAGGTSTLVGCEART